MVPEPSSVDKATPIGATGRNVQNREPSAHSSTRNEQGQMPVRTPAKSWSCLEGVPVGLIGPDAPDSTPFPLRRIQDASGPSERLVRGDAPRRPALSKQNGQVPRRNNARNGQGRQPDKDHRISGLGSHWRADGLPKTAYASQGDALSAALVRGQESGVELNVYRCDVCSAWHMGNARRAKSS
jgi:hypothetical protein